MAVVAVRGPARRHRARQDRDRRNTCGHSPPTPTCYRHADLARLERWLNQRLTQVGEAAVRRPAESSASWHHLQRIRHNTATGQSVSGGVLVVKQEVTAVLNFLTWLLNTHSRTTSDCTQADIDQWPSKGNIGRWAIR